MDSHVELTNCRGIGWADLVSSRCTVAITGCVLTGRPAWDMWGDNRPWGVYADETSGTVVKSVVSGATRFDGDLAIANCTFIGGGGGGTSFTLRAGAKATSCIVWGDYRTIDVGSATVSYSIVAGDTTFAGTGNSNADPLFVDPDNRDYRLQSGSPAIDAGDPNSPKDPDGSRADIGALGGVAR